MLLPVVSGCNRPDGATKQMEKIVVARGGGGTEPLRLHLLLRRRPAVAKPCEKLKGKPSAALHESHTITQDESKEEHFGGGTQRKVGEEKRVTEKVKPAVFGWSGDARSGPRSSSIKRSICLYWNIRDVPPGSNWLLPLS